MKRCSVKPYEGEEKYIFISYCHKDKCFVFPIIEQMAKDGYRVWYDEGIDPGSEWPEIIAQHLNCSSACIAFISENSLNSHNCRREINFALLKKKPFISVVMEQVQMSLGMEMQLSATQAIFKYTLSDETEFFKKLYDAKFLKYCYDAPNPCIVVSKPEDYMNDYTDGLFGESSLRRDTFNDKWFLGQNEEQNDKCPSSDNLADSVTEEKNLQQINTSETAGAWLVRVKTNEKIKLSEVEIKLGRSETMSDYTIVGNSAIGRVHAKIVMRDAKYYLVDNNSKNKTFLNTKELEAEKEYLLENGDSVHLANEKFLFHQE